MEGAFHEEIWLHIGIVHIFVHCQQLCKREKRRRFPLMSFLPSSFTHSPFTHFFPSLLSIGIDQFRWVEVSSVILKFKHDDKYSKVQNVLRNVLCNLLAEVIFSFTTRAQDLKKGGFKKKNEVIDSKPVQGFKERAYENTRRGKGKATQPTFLFQILRFNVENEMKVKWGKKKKKANLWSR